MANRFLQLVIESAIFNIGNELLQVLKVNRRIVDHVMVAAIRSGDQTCMRNDFGHALRGF